MSVCGVSNRFTRCQMEKARAESGGVKTANQKCAAEVIIAVGVHKYDVRFKHGCLTGSSDSPAVEPRSRCQPKK